LAVQRAKLYRAVGLGDTGLECLQSGPIPAGFGLSAGTWQDYFWYPRGKGRRPNVMLTRVFLDSPELYDAIYKFKDYRSECKRLANIIDEAVPGARTILDVACGTGEHAKFLKHKYAVDGVDLNERYLRAARSKNPAGNYICADMTDLALGRTYDVVTCLFSAIGIVRKYELLERAIACMARHVRPGGALIIEPWFTPDQWHPRKSFLIAGEVGADKVYRISTSIKERQHSVLLYDYVRCTPHGIEHYRERVELGLFTRDEMAWAFEFAGMQVRYDSDGLMGRGLHIGQHAHEIGSISSLDSVIRPFARKLQ
jgi:SAM-dependent methyltransferase